VSGGQRNSEIDDVVEQRFSGLVRYVVWFPRRERLGGLLRYR
jgi:hypothetical protein